MAVYFLALGQDHIKIGYARIVSRRIEKLRVFFKSREPQFLPIGLIGTIPGDRRTEHHILISAPGVKYNLCDKIIEIFPRTPELESYVHGLLRKYGARCDAIRPEVVGLGHALCSS